MASGRKGATSRLRGRCRRAVSGGRLAAPKHCHKRKRPSRAADGKEKLRKPRGLRCPLARRAGRCSGNLPAVHECCDHARAPLSLLSLSFQLVSRPRPTAIQGGMTLGACQGPEQCHQCYATLNSGRVRLQVCHPRVTSTGSADDDAMIIIVIPVSSPGPGHWHSPTA